MLNSSGSSAKEFRVALKVPMSNFLSSAPLLRFLPMAPRPDTVKDAALISRRRFVAVLQSVQSKLSVKFPPPLIVTLAAIILS